MKITFASLAVLAVYTAAAAVYTANPPVAEGFIDWEGVSPKNHLCGREITASDLRHRAVVYVVVDAAKFDEKQAHSLASLAKFAEFPGFAAPWDMLAFPREKIVVFSVRGEGADAKKISEIVGGKSDKVQNYVRSKTPFYANLTYAGEPELSPDKMPYVAVFQPSGVKPIYEKERCSPSASKTVKVKPKAAPKGKAAKGKGAKGGKNAKPSVKTVTEYMKISDAVKKAVAETVDWCIPLGVGTPKFFTKEAAAIAAGKPATPLFAALLKGIKSKNPEQAREAQTMYDALNQQKSELPLRMELEFRDAPGRAYADYLTFVRLFPDARRSVAGMEGKLKEDRSFAAVGKIIEKVVQWNDDRFMCKNQVEAKKIVAELKKMKQAVRPLTQSQNAKVQGEANLMDTTIDSLIETIPSRVAPDAK